MVFSFWPQGMKLRVRLHGPFCGPECVLGQSRVGSAGSSVRVELGTAASFAKGSYHFMSLHATHDGPSPPRPCRRGMVLFVLSKPLLEAGFEEKCVSIVGK